MNKAELVGRISGEVGITKKQADNVLDAITEAIAESLSQGKRVTLVGFGTFWAMQRKARRGRNPQTGEDLQIPAKRVPKFRPGKELRKNVQ